MDLATKTPLDNSGSRVTLSNALSPSVGLSAWKALLGSSSTCHSPLDLRKCALYFLLQSNPPVLYYTTDSSLCTICSQPSLHSRSPRSHSPWHFPAP